MTLYLKYALRFVILVLLQVIVLNHVNFSGYLNPYLYVLFILILPFETPGWVLLITSFLIGYSVDIFSNTQGMNAAASVFMGFCRPLVIRMVTTQREFEQNMQPGIRDMGFRWFLSYSLLLIFLHHLVLFYLEAFSFNQFFSTLFRATLSALFTLALVILSQYLFLMKKR
jgi:rod shape-determining protein MreD